MPVVGSITLWDPNNKNLKLYRNCSDTIGECSCHGDDHGHYQSSCVIKPYPSLIPFIPHVIKAWGMRLYPSLILNYLFFHQLFPDSKSLASYVHTFASFFPLQTKTEAGKPFTPLQSNPLPRVNPITYSGQEVLLLPVGQEVVNMEVFRGLFHDDEGETSYLWYRDWPWVLNNCFIYII